MAARTEVAGSVTSTDIEATAGVPTGHRPSATGPRHHPTSPRAERETDRQRRLAARHRT